MFPDRTFEDVGEAEDPACPLRGGARVKSTDTSNYGKATDRSGRDSLDHISMVGYQSGRFATSDWFPDHISELA